MVFGLVETAMQRHLVFVTEGLTGGFSRGVMDWEDQGTFLCLKRGGSKGPSTTSDILMIRCFEPSEPPC